MSKVTRKVTPQDQTNRYIVLETKYGQKQAAAKLGISTDSFRRYRDGKRNTPDQVYQKLNRNYNRVKKQVTPDQIQERTTRIQHRQYGAVQGEEKWRKALIYPDYIAAVNEQSPLNEASQAMLEKLHEQGYVASWYGGKDIPREVQFIKHNDPPDRIGKKPKILVSINPYYNPKGGKPKEPKDDEMNFIREIRPHAETARKYIRINKSDDYLTRIRKMDRYAKADLRTKIDKKQSVENILGFYYDDNDEV